MTVSAVYSSTNLVVKPPAGQSLTVAEALVTLNAYRAGSVKIEDTADNISSSLSDLQKFVSRITLVTVSPDTDTLTVKSAQLKASSPILGKFSGNYQLNVKDASVADMASLEANLHVNQFSVADNAANLSANLDRLQSSSKLAAITVSGANSTLSLTYAQLGSDADAIGKITNNYSLIVNDVKVEKVSDLAKNTRVATMNIKDTGKNISDGIDTLDNMVGRIGKINDADQGLVALSSSAYSVSGMVLGKIYSGYQIAIQSASLPQTLQASKSSKVRSIDVEDSGANFVANIAALSKVGAKISRINITDAISSTVNLSYAQFTNYASLLSKINTPGLQFTVNGVSLANLSKIQTNDLVKNIGITDTATNVSAALDSLTSNDKVNTITLAGRSNTIALTATQLKQDSVVLGEISNAYTLAISQVLAKDASALANTSGVTSLSVSDEAGNISKKLDELQGLSGVLKSISVSDGAAIDLTAAQYSGDRGAILKIAGNYLLNVAGVSASTASAVGADGHVATLTVNDTAKNISSYFNSLDALGSKLSAVSPSDVGQLVTLTQNQYLTKTSTTAKINGGQYALGVTGVSAGYAVQIANNTNVASLSVVDTSKNINNYLDELAQAAGRATPLALTITITNSASSLTLTADQYQQDKDALDAIVSNYSLVVTGVAAADASEIAAKDRVIAVSVTDSADNVTDALPALKALGNELSSITMNGGGLLSWSASQFALNQSILGKINNAYSLNVNEVSAASAAQIASQKNVSKVFVSDTAANLSTYLDTLAFLDGKLGGVDEVDSSNPIDITAKEWVSDSSTLAKFNGGSYTVNVHGATAAQVQAMAGDEHVQDIHVLDTAVNLVGRLSDLDTNSDQVASITLSGSPSVSLTADQLNTFDDSVLSKIVNFHTYVVKESSVEDALTFADRQDVSSIAVSDSGDAIGSNLPALTAMGGKLKSLYVTSLPGVATPPIELTAGAYAANTSTLNKITNSYSLNLSDVTAINAVIWGGSVNITAMSVTDTLANISTKLDGLNAISNKISQVQSTGTDADPLLTFSAKQLVSDLSVLNKVDNAISWRVQGMSVRDALSPDLSPQVAALSINDTSGHIAEHLDDLQLMSDKLVSITQSGIALPMSITADQFANDADTLAKIQNNYNLKVSQVLAQDAKSTASQAHVYSVSVNDASASIVDQLGDLQALGSKLSGISATDSLALPLSQADYMANQGAIKKMAPSMSLEVSSVNAGDATSISSDPRVSTVNLSDTSAALSRNMDALNELGGKLGFISQTDLEAVSLTVDQLKSDIHALSAFDAPPDLVIGNVKASEATAVSDLLAGYGAGSSFSVIDSATSIKANWPSLIDLSQGGQLTSVTVSDPTTVLSLTADQYAAAETLFGKISGNFSFSVSEMGFDDAQTLLSSSLSSRVSSVSVKDESDTIALHLDALQSMGSKLSAITQTGTPSELTITRSQLILDAGALSKINDGYSINLTDATASQALSLANQGQVTHVSIKDTADNISKNWDALAQLGNKLIKLDVSDHGIPTISEPQLNVEGAVIAVMPDNTLFVSNALAEHAAAIAENYPNARINIADTAQNIADNFDALALLSDAALRSITVNNNEPISLSAAQMHDDAAVISKLVGSYGFTVSEVAADKASTMANTLHVASIAVSDSSAKVRSQLPDLEALAAAGQLKAISLTDDAPMSITSAQYNDFAHAIGLIKSNLNLEVTDVAPEDADAIASNTAVISVSVKGTASSVSANMSELQTLAPIITSVTVTGGQSVQMSYEDYANSSDLIEKMAGATFSLSQTPISGLTALAGDSKVNTMSMVGGSQDIAARWNDLVALGNRLTSIQQSGSTSAMAITTAQFASSTNFLSKFTDSYELSLSGVHAQDAKSLLDGHTQVANLSISDTGAHIGANLSDLLALGDKVSLIHQTDGAVIAATAEQFQLDTALAGLFDKPTSFAVSGVSAADALDLGAMSHVASMSVSDTSDNVTQQINDLQDMSAKITSITLSDASPAIDLDVSDWRTSIPVISKISSRFALSIRGVAASDAASIAASTSQTTATSVSLSVDDSEQNILNNLDSLNALVSNHRLKEITVSDTHELNLDQNQSVTYAALVALLS